jgi:hypothetical protein
VDVPDVDLVVVAIFTLMATKGDRDKAVALIRPEFGAEGVKWLTANWARLESARVKGMPDVAPGDRELTPGQRLLLEDYRDSSMAMEAMRVLMRRDGVEPPD